MTSFEESQAVAPLLIVLDEAGSTNDELAARAASESLPPYTALVTRNQTTGRGRRDRGWTMPAGRGLAISVLLPSPAPQMAPWLPLAAGVAMRDAVAAVLSPAVLPAASVALKWPNDVLVAERKVCGVLGRLTPDGVIMGAGLNVRLTAEDLPVPTATSLVLEGVADDDGLDDRMLAGYLTRLRELVESLRASGGEGSGLRAAALAACETIGREVRVELPDGSALVGHAVDIAPDARLVVRTRGGSLESVAAGDVVHVRPAG